MERQEWKQNKIGRERGRERDRRRGGERRRQKKDTETSRKVLFGERTWAMLRMRGRKKEASHLYKGVRVFVSAVGKNVVYMT